MRPTVATSINETYPFPFKASKESEKADTKRTKHAWSTSWINNKKKEKEIERGKLWER